ncbi:MAG: YciI family protein [Planctomycetota bacterium]
MNQYLLSVHSSPDSSCHTQSPEADPAQMQAAMKRIETLEEEMKSTGAWMFSGRLTEASSATVVSTGESGVLMTDGPFIEAKEHIAGFYILQAVDLDQALAWAAKVTEAVGQPIEVRPFWAPPEH